jgi:lipopolysaccharide export system protein LptA
LLLSLPAFAQVEDLTQQPITITADRAEIDERRGTSTYTGNVVLTQGDVRMEADRLLVHTKDGDLQSINAEGNPVRYQAVRNGGEPLQGNSLRMRYEADTGILLLLDKAEFWQGPNRFSGERIQYDRKEARVTAGQGENGGERVQVTIQPKAKPQVEAPDEARP